MLTKLRAVGGSIAMTIPKAIVDELGLRADGNVEVVVEAGRMIMRPSARPRYKLEDLLARCDPTAQRNPDLQAWLDAPAVGDELTPE